MIDRIIGSKCTGCTSCINSCSQNAIIMEYDKEGFAQPKIVNDKCIECGLCIKKCPIISDSYNERYNQPQVHAAWNLDEKIRLESTSGGIFSALAKAFIEKKKGIVVGARYSPDFTIEHCMIENVEDIELLRQSKYAQSHLGSIFSEIKKQLGLHRNVLFCGTPCQNAGLQSYLKKEYSNLYCCDFICRGVISPAVYRKFLNDVESLNKSTIMHIQFKNKDYGWNNFSTKITGSTGMCYQKTRDEDYYMKGFLKHNLYLRNSCYECAFKKLPRGADITLGDFWGIGQYKSCLDNNKGTSVILINSGKGHELFDSIKADIYSEERMLSEVVNGNQCLMNSANKGEYREYFFKNIDKMNFFELITEIDKLSLKITLKDRILQYIHRISIGIRNKLNIK